MKNFDELKFEVSAPGTDSRFCRDFYMARGYKAAFNEPNVIARARAIEALFTGHEKIVYRNDRIAGSIRGLFTDISDEEDKSARDLVTSYGRHDFWTNFDHFAPDYKTALELGIPGILENIRASQKTHQNDRRRVNFLKAAEICMEAFRKMVGQYAEAAGPDLEIADACRALSVRPPYSFREALQLVWLIHVSFLCEGRYAMALGRLDQYLFPYYERDIRNNTLKYEEAVDLLACTFIKIGEYRLHGNDDVVNICIGGVKRDGDGGINPLSYAVLEAVRRCNIPGPNLSARLYDGAPREFLDACLQVIGTGLGYPALMNDSINIPALARHGYSPEDCRDYCFVGCIENFIQGKQPPWSDGRFNAPKYLELALNDGVCMLTDTRLGPSTGEAGAIDGMDSFMAAFKKQIEYGASEYMARFTNHNDKFNRENYQQPYLSCYCQDCIGRGLDINNGGALYPSAHGACGMGIATVADSLAAIQKIVFEDRLASLVELRDALRVNFNRYETLRRQLANAPKYGNDVQYADLYAVWYVDFLYEIFSKYRTPDGGPVYIAMASNTGNIPAGLATAATPDGRFAREPLSDAASPTYGRDVNGPTAVVNSLSKPDYTKVSCGTVLNQKYEPSMFTDVKKRRMLANLIETYFKLGGQEMQINAVSRDVLQDAIANPEKYRGLVTRVSGFSAYYVTLDPAVQRDILNRTEFTVHVR